jgi:uncharacterized NAD-dependent epimerase/dehydratase family protein
MRLKPPYLMFLGDAPDQLAAKTAQGVVDWRPDICMSQLRLDGCKADLGLADMTLEEAADKGAKTLILGVANRGGKISTEWIAILVHAIELGYDLASGLHNKLADIPAIVDAAKMYGRQLFDVRHPTETFAVASGKKRSGKRILPVGTDCSVGKMYTALALTKEMQDRDMKVDFRATGQTGIFIVGEGVSVDAVVSDFISGATESLSPANDDDHWDVVEGQGSLFHASYAGVTMGLIHGSQPDYIVLCHEPTRHHMRGLPDFKLPSLTQCMEANLNAARLTNPNVKCIGIAINTKAFSEEEAEDFLKKTEAEMGLPTVDPVRSGVGRLVDALS